MAQVFCEPVVLRFSQEEVEAIKAAAMAPLEGVCVEEVIHFWMHKLCMPCIDLRLIVRDGLLSAPCHC
jgi:hypothetical protein